MTGAFTDFAEVEAVRRPSIRLILLAFLLFAALASVQGLAQAACSPGETRLCLNGNRFQAEIAWNVPGLGSGAGQAVPLSDDSGLFWFFASSNLELTVKVLDGRAVNRHFWVFYGGLSTVDYTLTITDLQTGARAIYHNPPGHLGSGADVSAFNAEAPSAGLKLAGADSLTTAPEAPLPVGTEFQVNGTTAGDQFAPAVAVAPDGSFMIVWVSHTPGRQPVSPGAVFGRVYDSAGNPKGGEFHLNTTEPGDHGPARVAANAAGDFMAVWTDFGIPRARLFGPGGEPLSGEITLGTGSGTISRLVPDVPDVTADPAGGFLVTWDDSISTEGPDQIHWQRFNSQGGLVGAESGFSRPVLIAPRVATSPLGGFLLVWRESTAGGLIVTNFWAQRLSPAGAFQGNRFQVNEATQAVEGLLFAVPVFYADGGFSVLWTQKLPGNPGELAARRYDANAQPLGGSVAFRSGPSLGFDEPVAVALPSGNTWVLWYEVGLAQDPDGGVFSGVFNSSWELEGPISRVNTHTVGVQAGTAMAASPAGLVATWTSGLEFGEVGEPGTQDGSGFGVFSQRFTATTCATDSSQLCLDGRFTVAVQLTNPVTGASGTGQPLPLTSDSGAFWFFGPSNVELLIKVLDGRAVNGHFWVFSGALSDVEYTITVTDTETHRSKVYHNAPHQLASRADIEAF
ncbi:MAG TPA: hypothetical protein VF173_35180 [Thermoanaerobaculia bacterium]|nr:hypothetical protein [Thermoanaerobaculia bacterium]